MTSYLQRLASNVIDPGGSIRPVLQPIFSAPSYGTAGAFVVEETFERAEGVKTFIPQGPEEFTPLDRTTSGQTPDRGAFPASDTLNSESANLRHDQRASHFISSVSQWNADEPRSPETTSIQPMVPTTTPVRTKGLPAAQDSEIVSGFIRPQSQNFTSTELEVRKPRFGREEYDRQPRSADHFESLVQGTFQRISQQEHFPKASNRLSSDAPIRAANSPGLIGQTFRERDEIQIHIGRIEVTAVTSAPPLPAARNTSKSLSLDDYLKRRDRRGL
jgi:hypothetical protein